MAKSTLKRLSTSAAQSNAYRELLLDTRFGPSHDRDPQSPYPHQAGLWFWPLWTNSFSSLGTIGVRVARPRLQSYPQKRQSRADLLPGPLAASRITGKEKKEDGHASLSANCPRMTPASRVASWTWDRLQPGRIWLGSVVPRCTMLAGVVDESTGGPTSRPIACHHLAPQRPLRPGYVTRGD